MQGGRHRTRARGIGRVKLEVQVIVSVSWLDRDGGEGLAWTAQGTMVRDGGVVA